MSTPNDEITRCPICREPTYVPFFELSNVPTQDGVLWNSRAEALDAPVGNIQLAFCQRCTYIGNMLFEPAKIRYDQEYSFSLHFSPTYQEFIHQLAVRLAKTYGLKNKTVLEIACGQGDFLRLICELGGNNGIGVDPSTTSHFEQVGANRIIFQQALFDQEYAQQEFDFVVCRQMLDHVATPRSFVEMVRKTIGERSHVTVYFEVPNGSSIFEGMMIRNILYEKNSWFTPYSLVRLFELSGFKVLSVSPCFQGGQYLGIEAGMATGQTTSQFAADFDLAAFTKAVSAFADNYRRKTKSWAEHWTALQQRGQSAIAWGAGSGALNFFSMLNIREEIPYIVDINPKRQGKFLPSTGQQVVSPEFLLSYPVDVIIITNPTYEREIRQQVADLGLTCDFWVL